MGKVITSINITPDGFADGQYIIVDAEFFEFTLGLLADTRTVAFGHNTFELFRESGDPGWKKKMLPNGK